MVVPLESPPYQAADPIKEHRVAERRTHWSPTITREQELKAGISVKGLSYALDIMQRRAPAGESPATTARNAVLYYLFCVEQGWINVQDEGGENIDLAS